MIIKKQLLAARKTEKPEQILLNGKNAFFDTIDFSGRNQQMQRYFGGKRCEDKLYTVMWMCRKMLVRGSSNVVDHAREQSFQ